MGENPNEPIIGRCSRFSLLFEYFSVCFRNRFDTFICFSSATIVNIVIQAARIRWPAGFMLTHFPKMKGSRVGFAALCNTLIQPLLHDSHTILSDFDFKSPGRSNWPLDGSSNDIFPSNDRLVALRTCLPSFRGSFESGRYGCIHSANTCSRLIGVPPQKMQSLGGLGFFFSFFTSPALPFLPTRRAMAKTVFRKSFIRPLAHRLSGLHGFAAQRSDCPYGDRTTVPACQIASY